MFYGVHDMEYSCDAEMSVSYGGVKAVATTDNAPTAVGRCLLPPSPSPSPSPFPFPIMSPSPSPSPLARLKGWQRHSETEDPPGLPPLNHIDEWLRKNRKRGPDYTSANHGALGEGDMP